MTGLEEKIWAAAFVTKFQVDHEFTLSYGLMGNYGSLGEVRGFTCAEYADKVVEKFREAVQHKDAHHLLVVQEENALNRDHDEINHLNSLNPLQLK